MATDLAPLEQAAAQLALDLNSTILVAGAEGMGAASPMYKNIRFLAWQVRRLWPGVHPETATRKGRARAPAYCSTTSVNVPEMPVV